MTAPLAWRRGPLDSTFAESDAQTASQPIVIAAGVVGGRQTSVQPFEPLTKPSQARTAAVAKLEWFDSTVSSGLLNTSRLPAVYSSTLKVPAAASAPSDHYVLSTLLTDCCVQFTGRFAQSESRYFTS